MINNILLGDSNSNSTVSNIVLKCAFSMVNSLNVCHINARSLLNKIDIFRSIFEGTGVHIIMVSETWLSSDISDTMVRIPGYKVYRNDRRTMTTGGGVALYIRIGIPATIVYNSENDEDIEMLLVRIKTSSTNFLLGCIYIVNPTTRRLQLLKSFLSPLVSCYEHILLGGDFNVDLLGPSNSVQLGFFRILKSFSLTPVNTSEPTRFGVSRNGFSSSLLDLFIMPSNKLNLIHRFGQLSLPGTSDHDLIYISINVHTLVPDLEPISYRDFKNCDIDMLLHAASTCPWNEIFSSGSIDDQLLNFNEITLRLFNSHIPIKSWVPKKNHIPYYDQNIKNLIINRNLAYDEWKRVRTLESRNCYVRLRNRVSLLIRQARKAYYAAQLNPSLSSKVFWNNIKKFGFMKTNIDLNSDENMPSCSDLNKHFLTLPIRQPESNASYVDELSYNPNVQSNTFSFHNVFPSEVIKSIYDIKSNAVGMDMIDLRFIKMLLPVILPYITKMFNNILTTSTFPSLWKQAKIIPVPKAPNPSISDFRPISILPTLSKAFENIVHSQLCYHLNSNNLLYKYQSGFRSKHSTASALLNITDDIVCNIERKNCSVLILLDFSKAFDTVNHNILCNKLLHKYCLEPCATNLVRSYLSNRYQSVSLAGNTSDPMHVPSGVPQGSILGPLLFSLFINDLPECLSEADSHFYADDVQLHIKCPLLSLNETIGKLNDELDAISFWASRNYLKLNASKSQAIIITSKQNTLPTDLPEIKLNNDVIPFSNQVKNLGVIFNTTLSWNNHIDRIAGQVYSLLRKLWKFSSVTPLATKKKLVKGLIMPFFLYCDVVYASCDAADVSRLNVMFNDCTRYVYGRRRYDRVSDVSTSILNCSFNQYLLFRHLCFLHRLIVTQTPSYLCDRIVFARSSRTYTLIVPRHSSRLRHNSYFVKVVTNWNSLPISVKRVQSHESFRGLCFDYIRTVC